MKWILMTITWWCSSITFGQNDPIDSIAVRIHHVNDPYGLIPPYETFKVVWDTLVFESGNYACGYLIEDPWQNYNGRQVGIWKEYFPTGAIRSFGNYALGAITVCQAGGPTVAGYSFKEGSWAFFYQNGKEQAHGEYGIELRQIASSCGDLKKYISTINEVHWRCYNEAGERIEMPEEIKNY